MKTVPFRGVTANVAFSLYAAAAYTDGTYVSFADAPPPLEETGGPQVKDISGSLLPGISKQAVSFGGEWVEQGLRRSPRVPAPRRTSWWTATPC